MRISSLLVVLVYTTDTDRYIPSDTLHLVKELYDDSAGMIST